MNETKPSSPLDQQFKRRLRLWGKWLLEGFIGICPILIFIILLLTVIMVFKPQIVSLGCREQGIRILGMILQLLGFGGVAYGLRQASNLFQKTSSINKIKEYFKRFPSPKNQTTHLRASNITSTSEVTSPRLTQTAGPKATLEYRIGLLETQSKEQNERVGDLEGELQNAKSKLKNTIDLEKEERVSGDIETKKMMAEAAVGGIHIEWYSLLCFVIGIILASASPEISSFFGHLSSCTK